MNNRVDEDNLQEIFIMCFLAFNVTIYDSIDE